MRDARRVGLLGGTFDPIHVGHLAAADAARRALGLDEVLLLTSHVPPHRPQPQASVHHRFAMVALAAQMDGTLRASDLELTHPGPSFTASTLDRLHAAGFSPSQLFFIAGIDAFAEVATWREYPRFLDSAHFVVVDRGDRSAAALEGQRPELTDRVIDLETRPAIAAGPLEHTRIFLLKGGTPDVSSTAIRERCRQRVPIAGLVPPPVERHILRHGLYVTSHTNVASAEASRASATLLHEQEQS